MGEIFTALDLNWYSLPVIAVSTVIFLIGLFILIQQPRALTNFSFFLVCLCVNAWLYGISFMYMPIRGELALEIYRTVTFMGVASVSTAVYFFSVVWLKLLGRQRKQVVIGFLGSALFYGLGLARPDSFPGVYEYYWGHYPRYGVTGYFFLVFFFGYFFAAFVNFVRAYRNENQPVRRAQIKLISLAFLISFIGSVDYLPKLAYIPVYPIGYLCVFVWIMMVAYAIIKYKLMDIETVIHKTVMWSVLSSLIFLPLGFFFYLLRDWLLGLPPAVASGISVGIFLTLLFYTKTIQPWIDHIFQRRQHDLERALINFSDNLVHLKSLQELIKYIDQTVHDLLYVEKIQVFLRDGGRKCLVRVDAENKTDSRDISLSHPFIQWLEKEDDVIQVDYMDMDPRFNAVRREAQAYYEGLEIKISVPLVLNGEMIGLINLGQKANRKSFRTPEIIFLSELRRAVTIAFSNSLRMIEMQENLRRWNEELERKVKQRTWELEEAQKQLVQAEKLATLGTLAGGVAHEINNPLTAILTNAQMLKMTVSVGDDVESVGLIEEGAKRCQAIVQKLMKYARKPVQQELFQKLDLNRVMENVLAFLHYQLEQDNIYLVRKFEPVSKVQGVNNELEQVFTNIILNARDAIKKIKGSGTINIETHEDSGFVLALIQDDGAGIAEEHLSKIFDPFFTTKDVGKGTGLGLSITYGIVEKHGGKIDVTAKEGEGAVFTVRLPKVV